VARGCLPLLAVVLSSLLLYGCAGVLPSDAPVKLVAHPDHLPDAAPEEVVVVINNNAIGGTHAGFFAGALLSDPSGSYLEKRALDPNWKGASLADYVAFQLEDGDNVRVYRFRLNAKDFSVVEQRVRSAGITPPLFCAVAVQNQIAGVGPFAALEPTGWTSPAALAERLDLMVRPPAPLQEAQR
jgi:hypothetical protein